MLTKEDIDIYKDENPKQPDAVKGWINQASCLDSAYERAAILQGLVKPINAVFPENRQEFRKK